MNRHILILWPVATFCLLLFSSPAFAAVTDLFEMDGNGTTEVYDDAASIYCDDYPLDPDCEGVAASNALADGYFVDPFNTQDDDIFGGAKDSLDISEWKWKFGKSNAKNDIEHAFAGLYQQTDPGHADFGKYFLYFGMDKLDNSGDAALGFWFLVQKTEKEGDGTFSVGHGIGDVLVQADVTKGGDVDRIDVYTWGENNLLNDPVAPAQGELYKAIEGTECNGGNPAACGYMNDGDPNDTNAGVDLTPWAYTFKGPGGLTTTDPGAHPVSTYFEAGLDLSALFPDGIPCLSSFIVETRQSQSETAELEDLLLAQFDTCSLDVDKTGPDYGKVGDDAEYTITITNDGALPLFKDTITDTILGDLTNEGNCGAILDPGDTCEIVYTYTIPAEGDNPLINTVTATYDRGSTTAEGSATHEMVVINPMISLSKDADPTSLSQGESAEYTITLTNNSSEGTPTLVCSIEDANLGINYGPFDLTTGSSHTIMPKPSVTFDYQTDTPFDWCTDANGPPGTQDCTNTATATCSPTGFPNEVDDEDNATVRVIPGVVDLTVTKEGPGYSKTGDTVSYEVTITNNADDATITSVTDENSVDGLYSIKAAYDADCPATILSGDSCTFTFERVTQEGDPDPFTDEVVVEAEDAFGNASSASDGHSVDLIAPSLTVTKSCLAEPVPEGQAANFQIDITNTGDVELDIDVIDTLLGINESTTIHPDEGECVYDADPSDGCLRFEAGTTATGDSVFNQVDVDWDLPDYYGLTNEGTESDDDTCDVEQEDGATRTIGFWGTHGSDGDLFTGEVEYGYTCHVFEDHLGNTANLGWVTVNNCSEAFGIFSAEMSRDSDGDKRKKVCKARLQGSRQLLAAMLNDSLDNGTPLPDDLKTDMQEALAAGDFKEIKKLAGELAEYNESGDDVAIIDADGTMIPHADPKGTKSHADDSIADCD